MHSVRTRGGNSKLRALRLETGNFAWASEGVARKTRIADVVYNASNNELVRTKTLVKNSIVVIDATPFRQWYESHYVLPLGRKRNPKHAQKEDENDVLTKKRSDKVMKKYLERQKYGKVEQALEDQFTSGRILGTYLSHPYYTLHSSNDVKTWAILQFYCINLVLSAMQACWAWFLLVIVTLIYLHIPFTLIGL